MNLQKMKVHLWRIQKHPVRLGLTLVRESCQKVQIVANVQSQQAAQVPVQAGDLMIAELSMESRCITGTSEELSKPCIVLLSIFRFLLVLKNYFLVRDHSVCSSIRFADQKVQCTSVPFCINQGFNPLSSTVPQLSFNSCISCIFEEGTWINFA